MRARLLRLLFPDHARHLTATLRQLGGIRAMLTEALANGEALTLPADRALARAIAFNVLSAENHLQATLGHQPFVIVPDLKHDEPK